CSLRLIPHPLTSILFPYTTLFRSGPHFIALHELFDKVNADVEDYVDLIAERAVQLGGAVEGTARSVAKRSTLTEYPAVKGGDGRSEEHTSELQSQSNLVCRLLLEK